MEVECKFDKNYNNVTSDWNLENTVQKGTFRLKSFYTPSITPDPRSLGTPWPTQCVV